MNATSHDSHKDFRKTIDIYKKIKEGKLERKIYLPPEDFCYGIRNRTPTPIKEVVNNGYGNNAEQVIKQEYRTFMHEKKLRNHLVPKTTTHFRRMMETRKLNEQYEEKPLYKLKMFKNVGSKVTEGIKNFKTYHPKGNGGLDNIIKKVQEEIQASEQMPKTNC